MEILTQEYLNKYFMSKGFDWQKQIWEALFNMQQIFYASMSAVLLQVLTWAGEPLPTWTELDRRDCFCMTSQCEFQGVVWLHRCWLRWSRTHIINDTIRIKDIVTDKHISVIKLLYHLYTGISVAQHKNHPKPSRKLWRRWTFPAMFLPCSGWRRQLMPAVF